jgi:hypothetical protein
MINIHDQNYKKHSECQCDIRFFTPFQKYRMYCRNHDKWLHTLTDSEANSVWKILDSAKENE